MNDYPLGLKVPIIERPEDTCKPVKIIPAIISNLILSIEIEQASINRKHLLNKGRLVVSDVNNKWSKSSKQQIGWELLKKKIVFNDNKYFGIRLLMHLQLTKAGKIHKKIKDVSNCLKCIEDMLENVLYKDDKCVMFSQAQYSGQIRDYNPLHNKHMVTIELYQITPLQTSV